MPSGSFDVEAAERAAEQFLTELGVTLDTDSRSRSAARMVAAYQELLAGPQFAPTTFANDAGHRDLVLARAVPFVSLCEHHFLPFTGVAHVGYLPDGRILGLSKLARLVEMFARRPQVQESLTQQIVGWLFEELSARGAGVVVVAEHICMTRRGIRAHGATTVSVGWRGTLTDDPSARAEFLTLAGVSLLAGGAR
ncbi:GTP cyclohydrolase I [Micromonospora sp. LOL_021]|uniref:GTP cyclohydrolase I n=1 Tax=Micromonospora sp. LOL_021 TaxID=3345417 RepID=UPI003A872F62